ncbi:MAG TPA: hypothetical protein DEP35_13545 [Deltaproteobacteria bacterium]|jgi:hypothetical protein|nr:hypothetical protein [Deltaproteobacteria bacterium]
MRTSTRKGRVAAITVLSLVLVATSVTADEEPKTPDATVKLSGTSVALGLGYAWGSGILTYKGKEYKFKINGLSAGAIGATSINTTGDVYHLSQLADFPGTYAGLTASATVGGGIDFSIIQNASGVYIQLHGTSMGMLFQAGPSGISLVMDVDDTPVR